MRVKASSTAKAASIASSLSKGEAILSQRSKPHATCLSSQLASWSEKMSLLLHTMKPAGDGA